MPQPTPYTRQYNFSDFQALNPTTPLPANQVDAELNSAKLTLDQTLANLALIQRDDGRLKNASVGVDQLDSSLVAGFSPAIVPWTTATAYSVRQTVTNANKYYICVVAHTSGTFATDLAASRWLQIADLTGLIPSVAAADITFTPTGTISSTNVASALGEIDTEKLGVTIGAITSVASAATVDLGAQPTFRVLITGTTAITSFGSGVNQYRQVRFGGALTLTHNATTLILPGASSIATAAGDVAYCTSDASGNWRVVLYQRADGTALVGLTTAAADARYARYDAAQSFTGAQLKQIGDNLALADLLGENRVINGDFGFWQRGTTFSAAGYTADRWRMDFTGGTFTVSRVAFSAGDIFGNFSPRFCAQLAVSGHTLATHLAVYRHRIEDVRSYEGQTITVQFWGRRTAGAGNIAVNLIQRFGTGGSPSADVTVAGQVVTLTAGFVRNAVTFTVPSIAGKTLGTNDDHCLEINFWASAGSNFNTEAGSLGLQTITAQIAMVAVNRGSTALEYPPRSPAFEELLCLRYFERKGGVAAYNFGTAAGFSTTQAFPTLPFFPKRAVPTITYSAASTFRLVGNGGAVSATGISGSPITPRGEWRVTVDVASGLVATASYTLQAEVSQSPTIDLSAEL